MDTELQAQLRRCQIADEHRLRRQYKQLAGKLAGKKDSGASEKLAALQRKISASQEICDARDRAIPGQIVFPEQLPVSQKADEIAEMLSRHQVLVVAGDTGSGKTTQLPKICLAAGLGRRGLIGHTQPRRLAAVSVADRIAEELGTEAGAGVAYQVRFNEKLSRDSYIKVMTDGILLAEIQQDRFLNRYEAIIIDEAHERSLNIDFLLGFLKQLLARRRDLKLIITSATIDVEKFSRHFDDAPVIKVSGRTYPVEVRYAPLDGSKDEIGSDIQADAIVEQVREIVAKRPGGGGDILVFLSGEREIRETAQLLRKQRIPQLEILPLYARLRHSEQSKIFKAHQGIRVVLATNVAETSLTVPGINYVIDTGLARISRYSLQSKVQRLPIEAVSQASANQRKGRCGRLANGICIRLYSQQDFESRPEFTDPEILRTNLAAVILRMKHLRLGEPDDFPFVEAPERSAINEGLKLLTELDALDSRKQLTEAGRQMAMLPVDPRLARMLITAASEHCLKEMLIIVSAMSIQDPRESNAENRQQAREKLAVFEHPESDFMSMLNLWLDYEQRRQSLSQNQLRKYCKSNFLSFMRMREWREVHRQLLLSCQQLKLPMNQREGSYEQIHCSIIAGSLNQIANRQEDKFYLGSRNRKFRLFPASTLARQNAKWIVTGELIETGQTFASMAARIQPQWAERMALHLVKREHYEPHWSKKRQEVVAFEKVQLYGLTLSDRKAVSYGKIDPQCCREIFLREALANEQIVINSHFHEKNRQFLAELARQEEKIRRPDFIVAEKDIVQFYEQRLPEDIVSTRDLLAWLKKGGRQAQQSLLMNRENLLGAAAAIDHGQDFPDQAPVRENRLKINYEFDPGSSRDGATLEVPDAVLNQLTQKDIDWAVPGILREKCIALIKGLPKSLRKNFIPVSGFVDTVLPKMQPQDGDLIAALLVQISAHKQIKLQRADFEAVEIPPHLRTKIRVVDEQGEELEFTDKLDKLQQVDAGQAAASTEQELAEFGHDIERDGMKDFELDELPDELALGDDLVLIRYPALVDHEDSVAVRLFADQQQARNSNEQGMLRLYMLRSVQQRNQLRKQFARLANKHALILPATWTGLEEDAVHAVYRAAFAIDQRLPRDKAEFEAALNKGKSSLHSHANKLEAIVEQLLQEQWQIRARLNELDQDNIAYIEADIRGQLDGLLHEDLLRNTDFAWLKEIPRYLAGIKLRLDKAPHFGPRDQAASEELAQLWQRFRRKQEQFAQQKTEQLQTLRWMLEEYRVSLFAQQLGTSKPVSGKRLEKLFDSLEQGGVK